jgi:hypothetical protein
VKKKSQIIRTRRTKASSTNSPTAGKDIVSQSQIAELDIRLNTLIVWIAQSANSPISAEDARRLIDEVGKP